ncbi:MAG: HAD-IIIA family hydrolase [Bacteroidales bacterium]|nr:HAD-IIIA family hydrolase [Bacteroidales bacterium]
MATTAETLFLDRDGVINRWLPGDYVRTWEDFHFLPGILSCLRRWSERFRHILVVSNQRGVAKGKVRPEDLEAIHGKMCDAIRSAGGRIDGIYVCTSLEEDDPFRKPQTGMFEAACRDFPDIRADRSVMLGDSESDMRFARNCGMEGILMETAALTLRFQGGASSDS